MLVIPYNTKDSSHVEEIRKILNNISISRTEDDDKTLKSISSVAIGASVQHLKSSSTDDNLFYKKLKLENISPSIIELSSLFYISAESYIRSLEKLGIKTEVIEAILAQVFMNYKEQFVEIYEETGDSQLLVTTVHDCLKTIDFGRHNTLLENNQSNSFENKGLIHLLADDNEKIEVWWGKGRFNE